MLTNTLPDLQLLGGSRVNQDVDRGIQVSYGDDDGPVINFYMASDDVVEEIQFRHRDQDINIRLLVQKN